VALAKPDRASLQMKVVKYILYSLLLLDVVLLFTQATVHEALDSLGWIILLAAFEYESSSLHEAYASRAEKYILVAIQAVAWCIVIYALTNYFLARDWLDLANASVWLLVCVAISYDVYASSHEKSLSARARKRIKVVLYAALIGFAITWGVQGDALDCFDAVLWIVCFLVIEMNIFKAAPASSQPNLANPIG